MLGPPYGSEQLLPRPWPLLPRLTAVCMKESAHCNHLLLTCYPLVQAKHSLSLLHAS